VCVTGAIAILFVVFLSVATPTVCDCAVYLM
jgi:hypothetical protein